MSEFAEVKLDDKVSESQVHAGVQLQNYENRLRGATKWWSNSNSQTYDNIQKVLRDINKKRLKGEKFSNLIAGYINLRELCKQYLKSKGLITFTAVGRERKRIINEILEMTGDILGLNNYDGGTLKYVKQERPMPTREDDFTSATSLDMHREEYAPYVQYPKISQIQSDQYMNNKSKYIGVVAYNDPMFRLAGSEYSSMPELVEFGSNEKKPVCQLVKESGNVLEIFESFRRDSVEEKNIRCERDCPPFALIDANGELCSDVLYYGIGRKLSAPPPGMTLVGSYDVEYNDGKPKRRWLLFARKMPKGVLKERSTLCMSNNKVTGKKYETFKLPHGYQVPDEYRL